MNMTGGGVHGLALLSARRVNGASAVCHEAPPTMMFFKNIAAVGGLLVVAQTARRLEP